MSDPERLFKRHQELAQLDFPEALEEAASSLRLRYVGGDRNVAAAKELLAFLVDYIGEHANFDYAFSHAQSTHIASVAVAATASTAGWHNACWDELGNGEDARAELRDAQSALKDIDGYVARSASYAAGQKGRVADGTELAKAGVKRSIFGL